MRLKRRQRLTSGIIASATIPTINAVVPIAASPNMIAKSVICLFPFVDGYLSLMLIKSRAAMAKVKKSHSICMSVILHLIRVHSRKAFRHVGIAF